jgi:putative endonuclease
MGFYVYVIGTSSPIKKTYVGWTTDIEKRLEKHNTSKGAKSTKGYHWKLLYKEELLSKIEAMKKEYEIKKNSKFRAELRLLLT